MPNLCKVKAIILVTTLNFPYRVDQIKYSEMNKIFRIRSTALCHKTVYHIIRFLVYPSPEMNRHLKRFCSNLFCCVPVIKLVSISHAHF